LRKAKNHSNLLRYVMATRRIETGQASADRQIAGRARGVTSGHTKTREKEWWGTVVKEAKRNNKTKNLQSGGSQDKGGQELWWQYQRKKGTHHAKRGGDGQGKKKGSCEGVAVLSEGEGKTKRGTQEREKGITLQKSKVNEVL